MTKAWILVGMMGSGKSTVGRLLAEMSSREFLDTDQLLVKRLGRPIAQLFSIYGESAFRDHETSVLRSLRPGDRVIATGGGIVIRDANWVEMQRLGLTVFLDLEPELLIERLERSNRRRPLIEVENWQQRLRDILAERRHLYEKADMTVRIDSENLEEASKKLYGLLAGPT